MSEIYCVKCRGHTKTVNEKTGPISFNKKSGKKGERNAVQGNCEKCGTRKVKWAKST